MSSQWTVIKRWTVIERCRYQEWCWQDFHQKCKSCLYLAGGRGSTDGIRYFYFHRNYGPLLPTQNGNHESVLKRLIFRKFPHRKRRKAWKRILELCDGRSLSKARSNPKPPSLKSLPVLGERGKSENMAECSRNISKHSMAGLQWR